MRKFYFTPGDGFRLSPNEIVEDFEYEYAKFLVAYDIYRKEKDYEPLRSFFLETQIVNHVIRTLMGEREVYTFTDENGRGGKYYDPERVEEGILEYMMSVPYTKEVKEKIRKKAKECGLDEEVRNSARIRKKKEIRKEWEDCVYVFFILSIFFGIYHLLN